MKVRRSHRWGLVAGLAVAVGLVAAAPAQAVTCANLQAALDAAPDDGTVTLDETCHDMSFTLKPRPATASLTLEGTGGHAGFQRGAPSTRILSGDDVGNITLRDLGFVEGASGGLKITGSSGVTLDRVVFFDNHSDSAEDGGGALIDVDGGAPVAVSDSTFDENSAPGGHGGGLTVRGASVTIARSNIELNYAPTGGGLAVHAPGQALELIDTTVTENIARVSGGGAEIVGPTTRITTTTFDRNAIRVLGDGVASGAGLYFKGGAGLALRQLDNRFAHNRIEIEGTATPANVLPRGGGEWIDLGAGAVAHSLNDRFTNNSLTDALGASNRPQGAGLGIGGCKSSQGATNRFENLVVAGNRGRTNAAGAGMAVRGCPSVGVGVKLAAATVTANRARGDGAVAGIDGTATARLGVLLSIVADNRGGANLGSFGRRSIAYSDVCAAGVVASRGNICADPLLRAPDDPFEADIHETQFSPTVDRGGYFFSGYFTPTSDYEGDARTAEQEDIGADEYTAPFVRTGFATATDPTSAILRGRASNSTYWFEYGPTAAYGNVTRTQRTPTDPSLRKVVRVNAAITGLRPGRTYHFRLIATNAHGTTVGRDRRFKTPAG